MSEKTAKKERKDNGKLLDEARQTLVKEREERIKKCQKEIARVLQQFNCEVTATVLVTQRGNYPQISIVSKAEDGRA